MYYSSETVTKPAKEEPSVSVKFEVHPKHHVMVVPWEHCSPNNTIITMTNSPLKIKAHSFDGLISHTLEFSLTLNRELVTLTDVFYDFYEEGFRIHFPKENMKIRKPETKTIPFKK